MEEIEIKFINVDKDSLEKKLVGLGAEKVGDFHYRRVVFDYPDFKLDKQGAWLRLRDEGDKVTLTFKQRLTKDIHSIVGDDEGMYEKETVVQDFDATREILLRTGLIEKMYQENKRTRYLLDGVECDLDSWPLLKPYIEIEGETWDKVYATAEKLGFKKDDALICTANQIYRLQGIDDRNYIKMTFDEQIERAGEKF